MTNSEVHLTENLGTPQLVCEGGQAWERVVVLLAGVVQRPEVSTGPEPAPWFGLELEWTSPFCPLVCLPSFNDPQIQQLHPGFFTPDFLGRPRHQFFDLGLGGPVLAGVDGVEDAMLGGGVLK